MKKINILMLILTAALSLVFTVDAAWALPEVELRIKVSGAGMYDYVVVGMRNGAGDGFDNMYDSFAPSGSMNDSYIYSYISHPEWNAVKADFRGDIKTVKESDEWEFIVVSNLPSGTPLTIAVDETASYLPYGYTWSLQDINSGQAANLMTAPYTYGIPVSNVENYFKIKLTAINVPTVCGVVDTVSSAAIGNRGLKNSLRMKLRNACMLYRAGDVNPAKDILNAFISELDAQRGKEIDEPAYNAIVTYTQTVLQSF